MQASESGEAIVGVLQDPSAWQLIGTLLPAEVEPVRNPRRAAWSATHSHHHPYREVMIALRGNGVYGFAGQLYPCRPGTVLLFDVKEPHDAGYPEFCGPLQHLWITLVPEQYLARVFCTGTARPGFTAPNSLALKQTASDDCLSRHWAALKESPGLPPAIARSRLCGCLVILLSCIAESLLTQPLPDRESAQREAIDAVRRHLRLTAGNGDRLDTLARLAGYSKFHFLRLFQRHTGQSLHDYVNACRLRRMNDLARDGRSMKDIAFELGFSCPSAFSRWRRAALQKPPVSASPNPRNEARVVDARRAAE